VRLAAAPLGRNKLNIQGLELSDSLDKIATHTAEAKGDRTSRASRQSGPPVRHHRVGCCIDPAVSTPVENDPGTDIAVSSATKAIAPNRPFQRSSSARPAAFSMTIWRCIPFKNRR